MTATGVTSKAMVALTCFIMDAAYPPNRPGKLTRSTCQAEYQECGAAD